MSIPQVEALKIGQWCQVSSHRASDVKLHHTAQYFPVDEVRVSVFVPDSERGPGQ